MGERLNQRDAGADSPGPGQYRIPDPSSSPAFTIGTRSSLERHSEKEGFPGPVCDSLSILLVSSSTCMPTQPPTLADAHVVGIFFSICVLFVCASFSPLLLGMY